MTRFISEFGKTGIKIRIDRMPVVVLSGVAYVKDKAGRRVLAEPKKQRGARR